MDKELKNYGLLDLIQEVSAYVLGRSIVPFIPYMEDGDWSPFLPKYEPQAEKYETSGCTVWGAQNQIEILYKALYGIEPNYSERFNYLQIDIDPARGVDPQITYESIRKNGLIDNYLMPVPATLQDFLDESDLTGSLRARGQNWLHKHDFKHEWLWANRPVDALEIMKEALKTSPLGVSVTAWYQDGTRKYVDNGKRNNHWCVLYKIDGEGLHIFDSYDHSKKILALDHYIGRAKRIWINKKTVSASRRHIGILQTILNRLLMRTTLLDVCTQAIGTDVTPQDKVADDVACAEVVTTLLKKIRPEMPIITGTYTLYEHLSNPKNKFRFVDETEPFIAEDIIISPTGLGKPGTNGHVGIFMENGLIVSNDSRTGKFMQNHTFPSWKKYYMNSRGYPVYIFRRVI